MTRKLLSDIDFLTGVAEDNSCSCLRQGNGYHNHQKDCFVHMERERFRRVYNFIDKMSQHYYERKD